VTLVDLIDTVSAFVSVWPRVTNSRQFWK